MANELNHRINGLDFPRGPSQGILTWHERPVMAFDYHSDPLPMKFAGFRPAIVMQGAMLPDLDFTLQSIEVLRRLNPQVPFILSTWEDADAALLERARLLGAQIVTSRKPAFTGQQNVNLQIVSAGAGMKAAIAAGATHILKTRTDQRLSAPNLLDYLHGLQRSFPLAEGVQGQRQRVIGISLNTFRYRMYGVSDMLTFGHAEDMLAYWTPPLDARNFDADATHFRTLREFSHWRVCEVYLCTEYLKRIGWPMQWTLADWWRVLGERFCIADGTSLDLFWPKYSTRELRWTNYVPKARDAVEVGFREWLLLHQGLAQLERVPEERIGPEVQQPAAATPA